MRRTGERERQKQLTRSRNQHVETFYSIRTQEPIHMWCTCGRGEDHVTRPLVRQQGIPSSAGER